MNIIKRNGKEVDYDGEKIIAAVEKANNEVRERYRLLPSQIKVVEEKVLRKLKELDHEAGVEEIQDYVIEAIQQEGAFRVATIYTVYRYKRELIRKSNTTDDRILTLVEYDNEEVKEENSNKNPMVVSVQRDYVAGEVSRDLTNRILLPQDVVEAHKTGVIHFHDSDYYVQHMYNCCLVNLEDMLQNGTVISDTMIEKPKSFLTACNIATQCIAQIASSQYGGQSITLAHLEPFVDISREKYLEEVRTEFRENGMVEDEE